MLRELRVLGIGDLCAVRSLDIGAVELLFEGRAHIGQILLAQSVALGESSDINNQLMALTAGFGTLQNLPIDNPAVQAQAAKLQAFITEHYYTCTKEIFAQLEAKEYTGTASGEMVTVTMNGKHEITAVKIKPEAVDPDDIEMLEDLIAAAVNSAAAAVDKDSEESAFRLYYECNKMKQSSTSHLMGAGVLLVNVDKSAATDKKIQEHFKEELGTSLFSVAIPTSKTVKTSISRFCCVLYGKTEKTAMNFM